MSRRQELGICVEGRGLVVRTQLLSKPQQRGGGTFCHTAELLPVSAPSGSVSHCCTQLFAILINRVVISKQLTR